MMRLPVFDYRAPRTLSEAVDLLAAAPAETMLVAGGTDVLPNMKRRQQVPRTLVALRGITDLSGIVHHDQVTSADRTTKARGVTIGASTTLSRLVEDRELASDARALWLAAAQVATPHLRNMGTIGGNLCLDTRCTYYDQSYEWRKAIGFCMTKDGSTCWVAPSSARCLAVSSTDAAPALMALGAKVTLVGPQGARVIALSDLYANDGITYLTRRPDEILTRVDVPPADGWQSTYWKLRRRGSFDFPVLSVAAAVQRDVEGTVTGARLVLGAVASRPVAAVTAASFLMGQLLTDAVIAEAAELAAQPARPMDNTDFGLVWRKRVTRDYVSYALRELRGDDLRAERLTTARQPMLCA